MSRNGHVIAARRYVLIVAVGVGLLLPSSGPSTATPVATRLHARAFSDMLVDRAGRHVFITTNRSKLFVLDFAGRIRKVFRGLERPSAMVLRDRNLYVSTEEHIVVIDADRIRRKRTLYIPGMTPFSSMTWNAGRLWFTMGDCNAPRFASLDPETMNIRKHFGDDVYGCLITSSRRYPGRMVVLSVSGSPIDGYKYDVRKRVRRRAWATPLSDNGNFGDVAISRRGHHFLMASGAPYEIERFRISDLRKTGRYSMQEYPRALAVHRRRRLIAGATVRNDGTTLWLFREGHRRAFRSFHVTGRDVLPGGLRFAPSGRKLFIITEDEQERIYFSSARLSP